MQSYSNQNNTVLPQRNTKINGTEKSPEIDLCTHGQLIYNRRDKNIQWGKTDSSISGAGKPGQLLVKE